MKNRLLPLFFAFLAVTSVNAQKCGTYDGYLEKQIQNYPDFYQKLQSQNQKLEAENIKALKRISAFKTEDGKKIIPVVVHNIYNGSSGYLSDAVIQSAIDALNRNINGQSDILLELYQNQYLKTPDIFAAVRGVANVEFRLAKITPTCETCTPKATTGIIRINTEITSLGSNVPDPVKALTYWNSYQYLNIWTVSSFGGDAGGGLLGYAQFPFGGAMSTDGVVLKSGEMGSTSSSTLTHEVGHWLGLRHIWGDAECGDDNIKDTPSHRYDNNGASESSPTPNGHPKPTPAIFPYHVGLAPPAGQTGVWGCVADSLNPAGEMFMNYMDYTTDAYTTMFSAGQIEAVNVTLEGELDEESGVSGFGFREYMWSTENNIVTGTSDGYFDLNDSCSINYDFYDQNGRNFVCVGNENWLKSNSNAIGLDVSAASWDFGDGIVETSDYLAALGYYKKHTYANAGRYDVTLMLDYNELREVRVSDMSDLDPSYDSLRAEVSTLIVQGTESELVAEGASNIAVHIDLDGYSKNSYWVLGQLNTDSILDATYIDTIQTDSTLFYNGYFADTLFYRGELESTTYIGYYKASCQSTTVKENYIYIGDDQATNTAYPYAYSFESENELNADWVLTQPQSIDNEWEFQPSINTVWKWTSKASNAGNASIMIDGDNLKIGSTEIISAAYDLSDLTTPSLKFSWSGAASSTSPVNELNVSYSSSCGKTWSPLGTIDAVNSANAGMYVTNFSPNASEWMDTVMTKSQLKNDNIMFKFEYVINGNSNNFYLDNIMIGEESDLMIVDNTSSARVSVYPNPTDGNTFIELNNLADKEVEVKLVNILGAEIMHLFSGEIESNYYMINNIDLSHLETGIYFVKVVADGDVVMTDKLILK
jgi:hypothetical protein